MIIVLFVVVSIIKKRQNSWRFGNTLLSIHLDQYLELNKGHVGKT